MYKENNKIETTKTEVGRRFRVMFPPLISPCLYGVLAVCVARLCVIFQFPFHRGARFFSFCRRCRCLCFILSRQCTCHRRAVDTVHIINLINKKSTLPPTRSHRASFTHETMYMSMLCWYIIYCVIYMYYTADKADYMYVK